MTSTDALVVVATSFPTGGDGSEAAGSFVYDLVMELTCHVRVHVVAPGRVDETEEIGERLRIFRFAAPAHALSELHVINPLHWPWIFRVILGGYRATLRACAGAAHVAALWGLPSGDWARRATKKFGISYDVWLLGSDVWTLGKIPVVRSWLRHAIRDAAVAYADGIELAERATALSDRTVRFLPSTRSVTSEGISLPRTQPPYRFLFLGRWHVNKGVDLLLAALESLDDIAWSKIESVEIQGGGPMHDLVAESGRRLQEAGRPVHIGSFLKKDLAIEAIARADWLLIPSRIESIPVVFSDAMKLHRPVITTPVGDLSGLVRDNRCGICCDEVSAKAIADAIREAIDTPTTELRTGIASCAEKFDLTKIALQLMGTARNE